MDSAVFRATYASACLYVSFTRGQLAVGTSSIDHQCSTCDLAADVQHEVRGVLLMDWSDTCATFIRNDMHVPCFDLRQKVMHAADECMQSMCMANAISS